MIILTSSSTLARFKAGSFFTFWSLSLVFTSRRRDSFQGWNFAIFNGEIFEMLFIVMFSISWHFRVRVVSPAKVSIPHTVDSEEENHSGFENGENKQNKRNPWLSLMLSKPLFALQFNSMIMKVEAPTGGSNRVLWDNDSVSVIFSANSLWNLKRKRHSICFSGQIWLIKTMQQVLHVRNQIVDILRFFFNVNLY